MKKKNMDGRDSFASNVLYSWFGYLFVAVSGFILPAAIDKNIGQTSLGIWDLSWSLVNYLNFAMLGIGSSVNRYVAMYRAQNDVRKIRGAVSSVFFLQIAIGLITLFLTLILAWMLPFFIQNQPAPLIEVAQWVVVLLGASLAVQFVGDISKGVITGCHRWDIQNAVMTISHLTTLALMIIALFLGGGLKAISAVYLVVVICTEIIRMFLAHRIYPALRIRFKYVSLLQLKEVFIFGFKTFLTNLPQIVIVQTTNIMVAATLGPATLAVFARPMALVRHFQSFMTRFSFVMTPIIGSLLGDNKIGEIRQFVLEKTSYGLALAMPIVLTMVINGDIILELWMGPTYANGLVLGILAIGFFLPVAQNCVLRVLIGMNLHGRIALISMVLSFVIYAIGFAIITIVGWDLKNAALLVAITFTVGDGIAVPIYACRQLKIPLNEYFLKVYGVPSLCAVPFVLSLISGRLLFPESPVYALLEGGGCGVLILSVLYWLFLTPKPYRTKITDYIKGVIKSARAA